MGDRCTMRITCRLHDVPVIEAADTPSITYPDEGNPRLVTLQYDEVNYADTDWIPRSIPFFGWHGSGDCYNEGCFAYDPETDRFETVNSLDGGPCVSIREDGSFHAGEYRDVLDYLDILKAVRASFTAFDERDWPEPLRALAERQGWSVFNGDQIQRIDVRDDGLPELGSDDEAYVLAREQGFDLDENGMIRSFTPPMQAASPE